MKTIKHMVQTFWDGVRGKYVYRDVYPLGPDIQGESYRVEGCEERGNVAVPILKVVNEVSEIIESALDALFNSLEAAKKRGAVREAVGVSV